MAANTAKWTIYKTNDIVSNAVFSSSYVVIIIVIMYVSM